MTRENAIKYYENHIKTQPKDVSFHVDSLEIDNSSFGWFREEDRVSLQKFEMEVKVGVRRNKLLVTYCPLVKEQNQSQIKFRLSVLSDLILGMEMNSQKITFDVLQPLLEKRTITKDISHKSSEWIKFEDSRLPSLSSYRLHIKPHSLTPSKFSQLCISLNSSQFSDALRRGLKDKYTELDKTLPNPEEYIPLLTDPTLVRAAQLALNSLSKQVTSSSIVNRIEWSVKMYDGVYETFKELLHSRARSHSSGRSAHEE